MISKADKLASSSLSNAPAAELRLRWKLWGALGDLLNDMPAALLQAEAVNRLLPKVTDEQLGVPRDDIRIVVSGTRLFAASDQVPAQEQAMKELEGLYAEFMGRTPPAQAFAARCRWWQAFWLSFAGRTKEAKVAIMQAHKLLLDAPAPASLRIRVATTYVSLMRTLPPLKTKNPLIASASSDVLLVHV